MAPDRFGFGPFILDEERGTLMRDGQPISVSNKGLQLLQALLSVRGQVVSKADLMSAAWGDTIVEESNLSVQIAALRKLLGPAPGGGAWIATVPRIGYRFVGDARLPGPRMEQTPPVADPAVGVRRGPSIAVLPFSNVSGETEQDYLADGITEDIITALTRFRWFHVTARNSSFRYKGQSLDARQIAHELGVGYLLEGSVRKSSRHVRISAHLINAASGHHIWADRYDLELTEIFAVQDAIAERVVGAIEPELLKTEAALAVAPHTGNMTAWDLVRQGTWHFHQITCATHLRARELFREACKLDPQLPEAHIWLGRVNAGLVAYGWADAAEANLREGMDSALRAVHLDERNSYSHYALAIISVYSGQHERAVHAAQQAIKLTPSFALGHLVLGMAQLFRGRAWDAIAPLERGLQLNPHDPQNFVWFNLLALALLFTGRPQAGLEASLRALKVRPDWQPTFETMACCYGVLNQWHDAERCIREMRKLEKPSGDALDPLRAQNPHWMENMSKVLERAGRSG